MKALRWVMVVCLGTAAPFAVPVRAQQNTPHLAYLLPAGGQQGTTFTVKVGGQFLTNAGQVYFSGHGIQAKAGEYARPMNAMQATQLRERMQELQKQTMNEAVRKEMAEIRMKLFVFASSRNISPVLAENIALEITIDRDAEPGKRELRIGTPQGLSNPLVFMVGQLPEFVEKESVTVGNQPGSNQPVFSQQPTDMEITLPATVNGRIKPGPSRTPGQTVQGQQFTPGDVDRYHFQARKGQQIVVSVSARELIPYLADAVPGWFQAVIAIYDADGKELAYEDDFRFHPDPVIQYTIPREGRYSIEIKDALYRGREDFVYRMTIGELPFVTGIFPLGGRAGKKTTVRLAGWNLPADKLAVGATGDGQSVVPLSAHKGAILSNPVPFALDTLPEVLDKDGNNAQQTAQKVKLPIIVNGRVNRPGSWSVFRFDGRKGEQIVAEVHARRLDSPLDSVLRLTDSTGKQLAFNDDHEDKGSGLDTHHADSFIMTTLPAKGVYYLYLGDAQQKGGPEYAYRLRISEPRPDFELRVVPSSINTAGGMTVPVAVYALRKDGFSGGIDLELKNAPKGFALSGARIPPGENQVRLTLAAPLQPLKEPITIALEGRATIQGRELRKTAVPAEDMMQAFAYRHLVPAKDLRVTVMRRSAFMAPAKVIGEQALKIPNGETARLQVRLPLPPKNPFERIHFELSDPPEGLSLRETVSVQGGTALVLQCDAAKAKEGSKGNLIVNILGERTFPAAVGRPQASQQRIPLGTLPAIPFEIVKRP